jgi:hypothetical protein
MQLLLWSEVHSLECNLPLQRLTIHFTAEKSSGVMVSLAPILPAQRDLLRILVESINQRRISADTTTL